MTAELSASSRLRLVLESSAPSAALAAGMLEQHLGLTRSDARDRLARAPSVLAEGLDPETARLLVNLLRSCGLRVRLDGAETVAQRLVDLSVQLVVPVRLQRMIRMVAAETGKEFDTVAAALQRPGGLVLDGLTLEEGLRLQQVLGRMPSLSVTISDPASAVYDVFLPEGIAGEDLAQRLRMMGAEADPLTGAVASGLDRALCRHLVQHFPEAGLIVLDRAFQRYELYLVSVTGWVSRDLADFLVARTGLPRSRFDVIPDGMPLRIELGLTHAAARQFRADYATIGLQTRMVLSGLQQNIDNPRL